VIILEARRGQNAQRKWRRSAVEIGVTSFDVNELRRRNDRESRSIHGARLHDVL
jgi:hypothetical protein